MCSCSAWSAASNPCRHVAAHRLKVSGPYEQCNTFASMSLAIIVRLSIYACHERPDTSQPSQSHPQTLPNPFPHRPMAHRNAIIKVSCLCISPRSLRHADIILPHVRQHRQPCHLPNHFVSFLRPRQPLAKSSKATLWSVVPTHPALQLLVVGGQTTQEHKP